MAKSPAIIGGGASTLLLCIIASVLLILAFTDVLALDGGTRTILQV